MTGADRKLAILIGSCLFDDDQFSELNAPSADINALHDVLCDPRIGAFDIVSKVSDPISRDLRVAVSNLVRNLTYRDTVLIYYSGHGITDDDGRLYFACKDTEYKLPSATAVAAQFIAEELDRCQSRRQIIILDCCFSGAFDRSRKSALLAKVNSANAFRGHAEGQGRYLLTASDETQYAYEGGKLIGSSELSVFTSYLVEGMRTGAADVDGDGQVSLDDLHAYISERMSSASLQQKPFKWTYRANGRVFVARNVRWRGFDVQSLGALADDLQFAIVSAHVDVRLGVVASLSKLMRHEDRSIAESAQLALSHLSGDPIPAVAVAANGAMARESEIYAVPSVIVRSNLIDMEVKTIELGNGISIPCVPVPEGKFLMGSRQDEPDAQDNELPQHAVYLEKFWISQRPVTIREFALFVRMSRYKPTSERRDSVRKAFSRKNRRYEQVGRTWRDPFVRGHGPEVTREHPVVLVSWRDAVAFTKWASSISGVLVDLPSEAQWEKAARSTDGRRFPWGSAPAGNNLSNFDEANRQTTPVGAYSPDGDSPYGCVDMAGNVWEWTNSRYLAYPFKDRQDSATPPDDGRRVLRGGSWRVKAYRIRCAFRKPWPVGECVDGHGFRVIAKFE